MAQEHHVHTLVHGVLSCRVEPVRGTINKEAIARYHDIFQSIRKAGIEPVATLHHFVHPKWFEDMGGFLEKDNLPLFVNFCETVAVSYTHLTLPTIYSV